MEAEKEKKELFDRELYYKREIGKYDRLDRIRNTKQADDFFGQFWSNYDIGQLGQDEALAWNDYLNNPTDANRKYAESIGIAREDYMRANAEALNDEGTVLPWISKDLAQYLPQFIGQNIAGIKGFGVGSLSGTAIPIVGTALGGKAGYVAGRAAYGYDTTMICT